LDWARALLIAGVEGALALQAQDVRLAAAFPISIKFS
jgi:hypothetical protein